MRAVISATQLERLFHGDSFALPSGDEIRLSDIGFMQMAHMLSGAAAAAVKKSNPTMLANMDATQLSDMLNRVGRSIDNLAPPDVIGFVAVLFGPNSDCQYVSSIERNGTPKLLRKLADDIDTQLNQSRPG